MKKYWAIKWISENNLDGRLEFYVGDHKSNRAGPVLFKTREQARAFRDDRFGYIRNRPDLKAEPHGWKFPRVERVRLSLEAHP